MSKQTTLIIAFVMVMVGGAVGYWWPQIWGFLGLFVAPVLLNLYRDDPPEEPPPPKPRSEYDDQDAIELRQEAADADAKYRAAIRRAKAARARLRRRFGRDGSGTDGGGEPDR